MPEPFDQEGVVVWRRCRRSFGHLCCGCRRSLAVEAAEDLEVGELVTGVAEGGRRLELSEPVDGDALLADAGGEPGEVAV